MIDILVLVVGALLGVSMRRLALLAAAIYAPIVLVALGLFAVWMQRSSTASPAVAFCDGVAGELRAGASLRSAVKEAAESVGEDRLANAASTVAPMAEVAAEAAAAFPGIGREVSTMIPAVAGSGAGGADLFDEVGTLALAQEEVAREVRIASAPAKVTGLVFVAAPILWLLLQARTGSLGALLSRPGQRIVVIVGLSLFLIGAALATIVLWRST